MSLLYCVVGGAGARPGCAGAVVFVKEADVTMRGARERLTVPSSALRECTDKCRDDRGLLQFHCHSFVYTATLSECVLYEEDIFSPGIDLISSPTSDVYQVVCVGDQDGSLLRSGDNNGNAALYGRDSLLFDDNPVPFQRYRSSMITADTMKTLRGVELGRCLDECLHQTVTKCMSVMYNPRSQECKLSRYDQSGSRIVYDADHDYYENLMARGKEVTFNPACAWL